MRQQLLTVEYYFFVIPYLITLLNIVLGEFHFQDKVIDQKKCIFEKITFKRPSADLIEEKCF